MIMYEIQLDYNMTLLCLLRKILKHDDLVLQVSVIKDNTMISLYTLKSNDILVNGDYLLKFSRQNVNPSEYFVKVMIQKIVL